MTQHGNRRPIDKDDWNRVYATLHALHLAAHDDEDRRVWELLRDIYEDDRPETERVGASDMVGDQAANREVHHALVVIESMMRGTATVPEVGITAVSTVCATPGCPRTTFATYCVECESARG